MTGSILGNLFSGRSVSYSDALRAGTLTTVSSAALGRIMPEQRGISTLEQASYFSTRSMSGLISPRGPNAGRLLTAAFSGASAQGVFETVVEP